MNTFNRISIAITIGLMAVPVTFAQDSFGQRQTQPQQQQQGQWPQQQPQQPQQGQWPQQPQQPQQGQWPQQQPQQPQQGQWPQQPQQPQQGQWPQPPQQPHHGQWPQQPPHGQQPPQHNPLQQLVQMEMQELGVAPQSTLKNDNLGGPTPTSIPGGRVITTPDLLQLLNNPQGGAVVLDVLGSQQQLPNAVNAVDASAGGSYGDNTQRQFENQLERLTGGRKDTPVVLYCSSINCWMSYNAALRAINAGYTNVFWYRGGLEAWNHMAQMSMQYGNTQSQGGGW